MAIKMFTIAKMKSNMISILILFTTLLQAIPAHAQTGAPAGGSLECGGDEKTCLNSIVQNTYQTLARLNNVPEQLGNLSRAALSWLAPDDSNSTSEIQDKFTALGAGLTASNDAQLTLQKQLAVDIFAQGDQNLFLQPTTDNPTILRNIPYINDMGYASILGQPLFPKARNANVASFNYLKNASGAKIQHPIPGLAWRGGKDNLIRYFNYYQTTMAVQTFNAYALSQLYTELQSGNAVSTAQKQLITQASSSDWFKAVAAEELGKVLRQILMYQSQSYIVLTQMVQLQKQLLVAQVMNNSLAILNNQNNEPILVARAQGVQPTI